MQDAATDRQAAVKKLTKEGLVIGAALAMLIVAAGYYTKKF